MEPEITEMVPQFNNLMRGNISEDEYWNIFLSTDGWNFIHAHDMKKLLSENMQKKIPGTLKLYTKIRLPNGNRPFFMIVSDHIRERRNQMLAFHEDIFNFVDDVCWSYDLGMVKKDKNFFAKFLSVKTLIPQKIVFIDDSLWNVKNAQKSHITSFHFRNSHTLDCQLRALGFFFE